MKLPVPPARPPVEEVDDAAPPDITPPDAGALVQHPDGWYWLADSGRQQFGPYASAEAALAAMNEAGEDLIEPGETLMEAEDELGIADWLDPDTGLPAEDTHTRLEDH
jgi:hypothetical protein